jgi:hypothetical protein
MTTSGCGLPGGSDRRLCLKHDKVAEQLGAIRKNEIPSLLSGTYPAVEAAGFALTEARDDYNSIRRSWDNDDFGDEDVDGFAGGFQPGT